MRPPIWETAFLSSFDKLGNHNGAVIIRAKQPVITTSARDLFLLLL
ncbi:hypothetical protein ACFLUO_07390 [Chloroflexota bacterium]